MLTKTVSGMPFAHSANRLDRQYIIVSNIVQVKHGYILIPQYTRKGPAINLAGPKKPVYLSGQRLSGSHREFGIL